MPISQGLMVAGGIGEGLREGVKTYKDFRQAAEEKRQRDASLGLMAAKQGYDYDPSNGLLAQNPLGVAQTESGMAEAGLKTATAKQGTQEIKDQNDPDSDVARATNSVGTAFGGYLKKMGKNGEYNDLAKDLSDPNVSPRAKRLMLEHPAMKDLMAGMKSDAEFQKALAVATRRNEGQQAGRDFRDYQLAERAHNQLMQRFDRDPTLKQEMTALSNVKNATALTEKAAEEGKPITKQQFFDLQQTILRNLGITGVQSMGERQVKELNSVGINVKAAMQFLSGQPQDIGRDNPLYQHVLDMARWQSGNVAQQYKDRLGDLMAGNEWIYDDPSRSKLKAALESKLGRMSGTVSNRQYSGAPAAAAAPKGIMWTQDKQKRMQELMDKE